MGVLGKLTKVDYPVAVPFNTGTIYDLMTGTVELGIDGKYYIRGGFGANINGFCGKGNTFKTTFINSLLTRIMWLYIQAELLVAETEGAYGKARLMHLAKIHANDAFGGISSIDERVDLISGANCDMQELDNRVKEIIVEKVEHPKDYQIETPFIDFRTGNAAIAWLPTFIHTDSFSELESVEEADMYEAGGVDEKKNKTIWLVDGNKKTMFIRQMRKRCEQYGLSFIATAHIGKNHNLDGYGDAPKQLSDMKQSDKLKNVGSKFEFLTYNLAQTVGQKILANKADKQAEYNNGNKTPPNDIREVTVKILRSKGNGSGVMFPFVISQSDGLLPAVTNYHYLRSNGYFGLDGNKVKNRPELYKECTLTRQTIREISDESYEVRRALELTAQYLYIQQNWAVGQLPFDFSMDGKQLFDAMTGAGIMMNDILNTRGHWVPGKTKKGDREYASIFDVLEMIDKHRAVTAKTSA